LGGFKVPYREARRQSRLDIYFTFIGAIHHTGVLDEGLCIATENAQAVCGSVKRGAGEAGDDVGSGAIWLGAKLDGARR